MKSLIVWARSTLWCYVVVVASCIMITMADNTYGVHVEPIMAPVVLQVEPVRTDRMRELLLLIDYLAALLPHDVKVHELSMKPDGVGVTLQARNSLALMNFDKMKHLYGNRAGFDMQLCDMITCQDAQGQCRAQYRVGHNDGDH